MMKKRIGLIVDNPRRDLPGLILVAMRLCHEGATCYLVPLNLKNTECGGADLDFVLLGSLQSKNELFVKQLRAAGVRVGVLETEGGVYNPITEGGDAGPSEPEGIPRSLESMKIYAVTMASDAEVRRQISCFCSWGTRFAAYASKANWYRSDQLVITGSPRFDFYAPPWQTASLCMSRYAEILKEPIVLLNASFPFANPRFKSPEEEKAMMMEHFDYPDGYLDMWQQSEREAMSGFVMLANLLAENFPKVSFVFRPHPFEKVSTYQALLKPFPNLHLSSLGTVDGWLLRAKAVVTWNSSTAIDAGIMDIPVLFPDWIAKKRRQVPVVDAVTVPSFSADDLLEKLKVILEGRFEPPREIQEKLQIVVEDWFYRVDGRAHQRVASAILNSLETDIAEQTALRKVNPFETNPNGNFRLKVSTGIKKSLGLPLHWSLLRWGPLEERRWDKSEKAFDQKTVSQWTQMLHQVSQSQEEFRLRPIKVETVRHRTGLAGQTWGRSIVMSPL